MDLVGIKRRKISRRFQKCQLAIGKNAQQKVISNILVILPLFPKTAGILK
jgi:hypothetical protein